MFLIRTAFWLSLVILLLPVTGDESEDAIDEVTAEPEVTALETFGVARDAMADLSGFCDRNPTTCETGSAALVAFGQKAQHGARMVFDYLADFHDGGMAGGADSSGLRASRDTLEPEDLEVPWRGPGQRS